MWREAACDVFVRACLALAVILSISLRPSLAAPRTAVATNDFLNSIGVVTTFPDRRETRHPPAMPASSKSPRQAYVDLDMFTPRFRGGLNSQRGVVIRGTPVDGQRRQ